MGSLQARSSSCAMVVECCRMKSSAPTGGSKTNLRRDGAQSRGKCSPGERQPDEAPTIPPLCKVRSVRACCVGATTYEGRGFPRSDTSEQRVSLGPRRFEEHEQLEAPQGRQDGLEWG